MVKKVRIGWDISHLEFTIDDHYYFSVLKNEIIAGGAEVDEVEEFEGVLEYDVVVLNYPESPFLTNDIEIIKDILRSGKRVILCGYYKNEDKIADNVNTLANQFGLHLNPDEVRDAHSNHKNDDLLPVTSKVMKYNESVDNVLFPCTGSITINSSDCISILTTEGENEYENSTIIGAEAVYEGGSLLLLGTCVFWDNYSITTYGNKEYALNLLLK